MKYYLISDNIDTYMGMRLAGIEGEVLHTEEEAINALERVLKDDSIGILLLTEKIEAIVPKQVADIKSSIKTPLAIVLPDRHGTGRTPDSITKYIREAIGIKV